MNILLDIVHPADVHFFRGAVKKLSDSGHCVIIASRDKDCTLQLLEQFGLPHTCISSQGTGRLMSMFRELCRRNYGLVRLAKKHDIDVISGLGGVSAAQAARWLGIRSVVFYDTESATLQNLLTYPFAKCIVVPRCYCGRVPEKKTIRYPGYHELAYLHPDKFIPDRKVAIRNGLSSTGDNYLIRLVSWRANHDLGLSGWSDELLEGVVNWLNRRGRVLISSERPLPNKIASYQYRGEPSAIHHVIGHCRLTIGESATVASESVVMGVPAVYGGYASLGYISEQEKRYRMVRHVPKPDASTILAAIKEILSEEKGVFQERHQSMLSDCIDVESVISDCLLDRWKDLDSN